MTGREAVLRAVRAARPAGGPELEETGPPGQAAAYRQSLYSRRVAGFAQRAEELGVSVHRLEPGDRLVEVVAGVCGTRRTYVEPALQELAAALAQAGVPVVGWDGLAEAEVGVTGADYGLAESATLVLLARPGRPRSASLLPPVHVAVLREDRILTDLFDLLEHVGPLPTAVVLASGPSRSADIEMSLAVGVHGPGTVHVLLLPASRQEAQDGPAK